MHLHVSEHRLELLLPIVLQILSSFSQLSDNLLLLGVKLVKFCLEVFVLEDRARFDVNFFAEYLTHTQEKLFP